MYRGTSATTNWGPNRCSAPKPRLLVSLLEPSLGKSTSAFRRHYCTGAADDASDTGRAYDKLFDRIEVEHSECVGFQHPARGQFERLRHADYVRFRRTRP